MRLLLLAALFLAAAAQAQLPYGGVSIPDCQDANGQHLNFAAAARTFSCGTSGAGALPSGMIAAFNGACPAGWTELAAAQGRVIVGLPSGGTLAGTVGTALTDLQDKTHSHAYTEVVNHTHIVTVTDPGHVHVEKIINSGTAGTVGVQGASAASNANASNSPTVSATTGITAATANPSGGVASGTTATKATSDVISYIQYRYCAKN